MTKFKALAGLALSALLMGSAAFAGEIVINSDHSDPAPKKAMEELIADFQAKHPDITVKWNNFDHEGYKAAIRNFLTADPPDVAAWYAGNRMAPFVGAGLFEDVSDVWASNGLDEQLKSSAASMTIDGKKWGVPYTYYQWGIYYRADIFAEQGITPPKTWAELLAASEKLKAAGITPFAIGTKALWPTGGWFDYLNLRVNGYEFHMELTSGKVPYTDPRVKAVFEKWAELVGPGYFLENHAAIDWQDAIPQMVQGKAAMYLMGNFAVATMKDGGLTEDQIGFMQFPEITPGIPMAEALESVSINVPVLPVLHNADVAAYSEAAQIRDALVRQLYSPVRWTETIRKLAADGVLLHAECGPGKVLAGLNKRIESTLSTSALTDDAAIAAALTSLA